MECYFCGNKWGKCICEWDKESGFEWEGFFITEPNVSECGRTFVDPVKYYGQAYLDFLLETVGDRNK